MQELDREFESSLNRLSVASDIASPQNRLSRSSSPAKGPGEPAPYRVEIENAKKREKILKARLRESQAVLNNQRIEADAVRKSFIRDEIARRVELDASTKTLAQTAMTHKFNEDADRELAHLGQRLDRRRDEVLRQTRAQLNLDFTRRVETQHVDFEKSLDSEVRSMAADMTRAHQNRLKELAAAYVVKERAKKDELEKRMAYIACEEEKNMVKKLSNDQVNLLSKLKAELKREQEIRLEHRKHEIKRAHSEDRKRRLLEIGRETKDEHDRLLGDLKRQLELEEETCIHQLENELAKEHAGKVEALQKDMEMQLNKARAARRHEMGAGYDSQRESLRNRLEADSRRELERIRSTAGATFDSEAELFEREYRARLARERDAEEDKIKATLQQQLNHKKKHAELELKREHQHDVDTARRAIEKQTEKELETFRMDTKAKYESLLSEKRTELETIREDRVDQVRRELRKKHEKDMKNLQERMALEEERKIAEAREDGQKASARAESEAKRIGQSETRQKLKEIAAQNERMIQETKDDTKAKYAHELYQEMEALNMKYKTEMEETKQNLETNYEKEKKNAKERARLEMQAKKDKMIEDLEKQGKADLDTIVRREQLAYGAELNTMKAMKLEEQSRKEDAAVQKHREEYRMQMEAEKLDIQNKQHDQLQRVLKTVIEELNVEHERTVKSLQLQHEEEKSRRSAELRKQMRQENEAQYDRFKDASLRKIEAICQQVQDEYTSEKAQVLRKLDRDMESSCEKALLAMEKDHTTEIESLRSKKIFELHSSIEATKSTLLQETLSTQARLRANFERDVRAAQNMLRELFGQTEDRKSINGRDEANWLNSDSYVSKLQQQYGVLHEKYTKMSEKLAEIGVKYNRVCRELSDNTERISAEASVRKVMGKPRDGDSRVVEKLMSANQTLVDKLGSLGDRYTKLENLLMGNGERPASPNGTSSASANRTDIAFLTKYSSPSKFSPRAKSFGFDSPTQQ